MYVCLLIPAIFLYREAEYARPQPAIVYSIQVRQPGAFYCIAKDFCAIAQSTDTGAVMKKFHIVERVAKDDGNCDWYCSCESDKGCMHVHEARDLWPEVSDPCDNSDQEDEEAVIRLSESVFAVKFENTYTILGRTPKLVKCLVCPTKVTTCQHVKAFKAKANTSVSETPNSYQEPTFESVSKELIPYPLTAIDKSVFVQYISGQALPTKLVPQVTTNVCAHGNTYDDSDPVQNGWIQNAKATLHAKHVSIPCCVYFRPTTGTCSCKYMYDGRDDLVLNLNNSNLYSYVWLFDILHDTQETRYPLAAAFRSANRTRSVCGLGPLLQHEYNFPSSI